MTMTPTPRLVPDRPSAEWQPCPFCGCDHADNATNNPFPSRNSGGAQYWVARCGNPNCAAEVRGATADEARTLWNRRNITARPAEAGELSDELALIESVLKGYPFSIAQSDALRAVRRIRALAAAKGGESISVSELVSLLPGSYYMDPPDGGDVCVLEQLRRMAADATRYRLAAPAAPAEGDDPLMCEACGYTGTNFGTIHYPAGDADAECPECGATEVDEPARAIAEIIRQRDEATAPRVTGGRELRGVLSDLLDHVDDETCTHEETHRGGAIWTICDNCGQKWADDEGGFVPHEDAPAVAKARAALQSATGEVG